MSSYIPKEPPGITIHQKDAGFRHPNELIAHESNTDPHKQTIEWFKFNTGFSEVHCMMWVGPLQWNNQAGHAFGSTPDFDIPNSYWPEVFWMAKFVFYKDGNPQWMNWRMQCRPQELRDYTRTTGMTWTIKPVKLGSPDRQFSIKYDIWYDEQTMLGPYEKFWVQPYVYVKLHENSWVYFGCYFPPVKPDPPAPTEEGPEIWYWHDNKRVDRLPAVVPTLRISMPTHFIPPIKTTHVLRDLLADTPTTSTGARAKRSHVVDETDGTQSGQGDSVDMHITDDEGSGEVSDTRSVTTRVRDDRPVRQPPKKVRRYADVEETN